MDFITSMLAKFFEAFKTKNPVAGAIILGVLSAVYVFLQTSGETVFGPSALEIAKWINFALVALVGTHTSSILVSAKKEEKK
jgi:hypothetical protein